MGYTGQQKRDYQAAWMDKRRQDWITSQGGLCAKCGSDDRLEVDHIDPSLKTMNPTYVWSLTQTKRELELANCQVLCHNCHFEKTSEAFQPHGTRARYRRGCKCAECRAANTESMRKYRA